MSIPRNTKIIATIGPSSQQAKILEKIILAGMDVARLNFSHGSHTEHASVIATIRNISTRLGKALTILQDLQGPKLRVGNIPPEGYLLSSGQVVQIIQEDINQRYQSKLNNPAIPLDLPEGLLLLKSGYRILIDDGNIELKVIENNPQGIIGEVVTGGTIKPHKGFNIPGLDLGIPSLTSKDVDDLKFGLSNGVDVIALSFVHSAMDIKRIKEIISEINPQKQSIPIIAKIEKPEAIQNLEEIIAVSDGVMIARGDLAVETSPESVPILQKRIIKTAQKNRKIAITATQMLDSMIHNPRPTRAEASDVANAIFDGSDALMLSGETAIGDHPIESVQMMDRIIREAENNFVDWAAYKNLEDEPSPDDAVSLTRAARELALDVNVRFIAVFTVTGRTALLMSKIRSTVPIIAFTPNHDTFQRMGLYWGIIPKMTPYLRSLDEVLAEVNKFANSNKNCIPGTQIILISNYPVGAGKPPNLVMLYTF